ncbi:MAG TPA: hypothetical protein PLF89_10840 [bacterium]|nr:hypothetical protein [bacterium]
MKVARIRELTQAGYWNITTTDPTLERQMTIRLDGEWGYWWNLTSFPCDEQSYVEIILE